MPKLVDHDQRRREIAAAVAGLAAERGLQGVSFREVAGAAGVSVSLVQHYFGTKQNLLIRTLDIHSQAMGERILRHLAALEPDADPLVRVRTVAAAFLPGDDEGRAAMLLYHAFGAAALTDATLRTADAFRSEGELRTVIRDQLVLARQCGHLSAGVDPETQARAIIALILGLSLTVLLEQSTADEAATVLDAHLAHLQRSAPGPSTLAVDVSC